MRSNVESTGQTQNAIKITQTKLHKSLTMRHVNLKLEGTFYVFN